MQVLLLTWAPSFGPVSCCCCSVGTAGLRGLMGIGFNRMNEVVVQQTTQGFCRYLQAHAKDKLESRGVTIGEHASGFLAAAGRGDKLVHSYVGAVCSR